ncbi:protein kinase, ATP binding site [Artemisia annua]|uniref:non-specific serine/threonine protein kinase n=1 Tax=Artemisia annua TaxID=35608 RepID=A0A2U1L4N1_ARTAN|nr:protein kinase, ATP binding site [Artemisia annua]
MAIRPSLRPTNEKEMDDMLEYHRNGAENRHVIFGKYEMGRLLGQGTFAKVYYARDFVTGESVAVKVIKTDMVRKEGLMEQIIREIAVMRLVRHPNVVQLKEVMATKTRIFLVIEYVKGGELFAKIVKGRLKEDVARKYFQQLIGAVDYCHSRGVSHRDLKPENLLLDENEDLKVSDFGFSALPEQLRNDGMLHTQCGTPAYVAPEVLRKKGYDGAKADIWSCGVILYVLLSGYLPFREENVMHMYKKIFKAEYVFPPWFSLDSRRLISKLLMVDTSQRITVPAIMRSPWFFKGLKTSDRAREGLTGFPAPILLKTPILIDELGKDDNLNESEMSLKRSKSSPKFYNAFEFISAMSSGFDLSNMFETKQKSGSLFTSKSCVSTIMHKLESQAKKLQFNISCSNENEYKLKMQGISEGRKGKLLVNAEVFEVAPEVAVVEFSKAAGDTLEYKKFEDDIRPGLQDIVWSWQGENSSFNTKE